MALTDHLNIAGRLTLSKWDQKGRLIERREVSNDITLAGRDLVARLFNPQRATEPIARVSELRVGGSDRAFDPKLPGLVAPIGGPVAIGKIDEVEVSDDSGRLRKMLRLVAELREGEGNGELREAGLFTPEGLMYNRVTFDAVTKTSQFRLSLVWEITF